jgi:putative DNA primase/helicase
MESSWRSPEDHAEAIVRALNGRKHGKGWVCRCPAHDDHHPSLAVAVRERKVLVCCRAGCSKSALQSRGLWPGKSSLSYGSWERRKASESDAELATPRDPMKTWRGAQPFSRDSPIDLYLKQRGIEITDSEALSLRFSPSLWHWPSRTRWPCMLAKVALATGADLTTHQTFVEPDGSGKAPLGDKARLFAAGGKIAGGGVWFGLDALDPNRELIITEGVESCLSAVRIFGGAGGAGCAALSERGMRLLDLPKQARLVRIFADHDPLGQGLAAAREAKRRWLGEKRAVAISMSPVLGQDANDVWMQRRRA